ncbi:MAG: hypothetical protein LBK55_08260 [Azoarcus sp.]|nr:hypothetical protein [Azoarcus sp.]
MSGTPRTRIDVMASAAASNVASRRSTHRQDSAVWSRITMPLPWRCKVGTGGTNMDGLPAACRT